MSVTIVSLIDYINNPNYQNIQIIDVRNDDYKGGNIPGAINIVNTNYSTIKKYVESLQQVIVHCMYSEVRGAGISSRLKRDFPDKNIMLLQGGFSRYFNHFINIDKTKIENLDMTCWHKTQNGYKHIYD